MPNRMHGFPPFDITLFAARLASHESGRGLPNQMREQRVLVNVQRVPSVCISCSFSLPFPSFNCASMRVVLQTDDHRE